MEVDYARIYNANAERDGLPIWSDEFGSNTG